MFSKNFPKARILYCMWHVMKSFKKNYPKDSQELTSLEKMTSDEYKSILMISNSLLPLKD